MGEPMLNDAPEREYLSEPETVELVRRELALHPAVRSDRELDLIERVIRLEEGQRNLSEQMDKRFEQTQIQIDKCFEQVDKRFEQMQLHMDKRFEQMQLHADKQFEQMDKRFEQMQLHADKQFEQMDKRFEQMQLHMDKQFEQMDKRFSGFQWAIGTGVGLILAIQSVILYFVGKSFF